MATGIVSRFFNDKATENIFMSHALVIYDFTSFSFVPISIRPRHILSGQYL